MKDSLDGDSYAFECRIRDHYARNLQLYRPGELVSRREVSYKASRIRADLRTINEADVIFEWEFKIEANYSAIGQVLTYVAHAKLELGFQRMIRPVMAAFHFPDEIRKAVVVNNLGIEMIQIPNSLREAGLVPQIFPSPRKINIPRQTYFVK